VTGGREQRSDTSRAGILEVAVGQRPRSRRLPLAAVAAFAVLCLLPTVGLVGDGPAGDISTYRHYGEQIKDGAVPYRDFFVEYPPGALLAFVTPTLGGAHYQLVFKLLMVSLGGLAVAAVYRRTPVAWPALALVAVTPLLLGEATITHYDLWPTFLAAAGIALVLSGRPLSGAAAIGLGTAAKVFPVVLAPIAVAHVWRTEGRRKALQTAAVFAGVLVAVILPFAAVAPGGVWYSLRFQLERPLQIESLGAGLLLAAHHVAGVPAHVVSSYNSQNLEGTLPDAVTALQALLLVGLLVVLWRRAADRPAETAAAAIAAMLVLGKVLSPQYLVWLVPVILLASGPRTRLAWALAAAAMALTQSLRLWDGVGLGPAGWIVLARNGALAALLVVLVTQVLSRRPRPA
jgi:uncharacterized membrane protein